MSLIVKSFFSEKSEKFEKRNKKRADIHGLLLGACRLHLL